MIELVYTTGALQYLEDLITILIREEYFSVESTSIEYVRDIQYFIQNKIATASKKRASKSFAQLANNLHYITYKRNKQTTWYIFFLQKDSRFIIEHITNNHVAAKHLKR